MAFKQSRKWVPHDQYAQLHVPVHRSFRQVGAADERGRLIGNRCLDVHEPLHRYRCNGYKAQVVDNSDGVVLDYQVVKGNPADAPLLVPAIKRIKARFGRVPSAVAADRGYSGAKVEAELTEAGVKKIVIPRRGKPSAARKKAESAPGFRKLVKWRTGCEGRIAALKHGYGWSRSMMDAMSGTTTWCGWGIFAHNGINIAHLAAAEPSTPPRAPTRPKTAGPPGTAPPRTALSPPTPLLAG